MKRSQEHCYPSLCTCSVPCAYLWDEVASSLYFMEEKNDSCHSIAFVNILAYRTFF